VVVKEARGEARRITVIDLGDGDSTREYESSAAWSSRTFVAVDNDSSSRSWLLLDDAAP
jgi:spermidine synthase